MAEPSISFLFDGLTALHGGPLDDASGYVAFRVLYEHLDGMVRQFGIDLFGRTLAWVGVAANILVTLWLLIEGLRILNGRSLRSMTEFTGDMLRAAAITAVATGAALGGGTLYDWVNHDLGQMVHRVITGQAGDVFEGIDRMLGYMQMAFGFIDGIQAGDNHALLNAKERNLGFVAVGMGGPAVVAGALLLMYKLMLALCLGFAPLFVLCLLFPWAKPLFWGWLNHLVGVLFALSVLHVMAAIAVNMICAVAATFWTAKLTGASVEGVNSLAMQQGGLGLILTTLIVGAPAAAAKFFKGLLGDFSPYSAFGHGGAPRAHTAHAADPHTHTRVYADPGERPQAPVQMHAHRVAAPVRTAAQEDRIKPAEDARSFLERYPNATASLGEPIGRGDPNPAINAVSARSTGRDADQSVRRFDGLEIHVISGSDWPENRSEKVKGLIAKDLNAIGDMIRRSGDAELGERFNNLKIGVDFDDWKIKYAGTQAENGYGQAYFNSGSVVLNGVRVESALSMHDRVEHTIHELRHLMIENNKLITNSSGTPLDPIEKNAQSFTEEFMNKYWRPEYEFYK